MMKLLLKKYYKRDVIKFTGKFEKYQKKITLLTKSLLLLRKRLLKKKIIIKS